AHTGPKSWRLERVHGDLPLSKVRCGQQREFTLENNDETSAEGIPLEPRHSDIVACGPSRASRCMKKAIIAGLLTACFCNFSFGSHENNPLGAAGMFIRTGDDNKDTNTSFTVELWTKDGQTLIAYLRSVEACPRGCEYPKG